jgi:hypothetical protein
LKLAGSDRLERLGNLGRIVRADRESDTRNHEPDADFDGLDEVLISRVLGSVGCEYPRERD